MVLAAWRPRPSLNRHARYPSRTSRYPARRLSIRLLSDPDFLAEIERRKYELQPVKGEELEAMAKDVIAQPPDVIERMRKLLGK